MVGGTKSHTPFDSRLLLSLVKCEKEVADSFKSYTQTCENANNALNGWAAADTGDSPDVLAASNRVCELFDDTFDAQRTYLMALNNYRSSLKDVAAREAEIRVILRDRDIFVSRLVKLNNKKPPTSDSAFEAHTAKLEEARAELAACESTLKAEERALVGVKRRIFREALRMRMRAMAQLADTWRESAERAIDILDTLDADNNPNGSMTDVRLRPQPPPPTQLNNTPMRQSRPETFQSPEGSVIAPSHSASQVARRALGIPADYSDDEGDTALGGVRDTSSLHRSVSMNDRRAPGPMPIAEVSHEEEMGEGLPMHSQADAAPAARGKSTRAVEQDDEEGGGSSEDERGKEMDPKMYQVHVNKPLTPRELAQQKARQLMAQKEADERGVPQQQQQQQQQQQPAQGVSLQQPAANAPNGTASKSGSARKRVSSAPASPPVADGVPSGPAQPAVIERAASPGRETAEERQKRFSTLTAGSSVPAYEAAPAGFSIPSANTFTIDAHKKKNAPEATLLLPSSTGSRGYQATRRQDDSDDEAADEVGNLKSARRRTASMGTPARPSHGRSQSGDGGSVDSGSRDRRVLKSSRAPSGRDTAYYSRSDAGTSTLRGTDRRARSEKQQKQRSEGHKSGGFFGAVTGLFKKRDFQSRQYGDDDEDDDDSVLASPKSRGTSGGRQAERSGSVFGKKKERKSRSNMDDSDSDAPDPRTLVRVQNNGGRSRPLSRALSDSGIDRSTEAAIRAAVNSNTFSSIPPDRKKALSDVRAPRVRKKSATAVSGTSGLDRKSSVKSTATTVAPGSAAAGTVVKKKKKVTPTSAAGPSLTASASAPALARAGSTLQTPSQRVTRDTPSLMSVVAPPSQSATIMNMSLPSAKNPSLGAGTRIGSPAGSAVAAPKTPVAGSAEPLKKKKTVKRSSTASNVNGVLLASPPTALKPSATTPNLLTPQSNTNGTLKTATRPQSALAAPRPASILSVGSGQGAPGLVRRKSVRLADDTKIGDARYENSGGPANIPRAPSPQPFNGNGGAQSSILKASTSAVQTNHNIHDYGEGGVTGGAGVGEWVRNSRDDDVSSDEGGDEYARIKHELSRSDKSWQEAGFLNKGKGRAY